MSPARKIVIAVLLLAVVGAVLTQRYFSDRGRWTTEPQFTGLARSVSANELTSERDPAVVMRFDPAYQYVGGQKFVLYGVADAEQHFFVETDQAGKLQRVFWIQFEGFLADNSYRYDYDDSPRRLTIGELEFYVDTAPVVADPSKRRRGSDGSLARQFLADKGYSLPQEYAYARLVHLTDESRRKELMIIFVDDLGAAGTSAADLAAGGSDAGRWPAVAQATLDRIVGAMTLVSPRD